MLLCLGSVVADSPSPRGAAEARGSGAPSAAASAASAASAAACAASVQAFVWSADMGSAPDFDLSAAQSWGQLCGRSCPPGHTRKFTRSKLLEIAQKISGRDKYVEPYGTSEDLRKDEQSSLISKAEKRATDADLPVFWRDQDIVIPAFVMKLPGVERKATLFHKLVLKDQYDGMHRRLADGSWAFWTATDAGGELNPMELPQRASVQCSTTRTMRLVIQPPPAGADSTVKGCADKVLVEEAVGSVSQEGGTTVALRPKVRTASKRLTKAECRAICRHYRQRRNQPLMGLTASKRKLLEE